MLRRGFGKVGRTIAAVLLVSGMGACDNRPPSPERDAPPPSASSARAEAPASAAASAAPAPKTIPKLVAEKLTPKEGKPGRVYAIEGALMVVDDVRVGRIAGDDIEWIGEIPKTATGLGDNSIDAVVGRWPDRVAVLYRSGQPRAPQPTYYPLGDKKAGGYRVASGSVGVIHGVARIGDSIVLSSFAYLEGHHIVSVQGPPLARFRQKAEAHGCKRPEGFHIGEDVAVASEAIESTPEGTLVTIGYYCKTGGPAAEVWDRDGKSRVLPLDAWWKKMSYGVKLAKGKGDELFVYGGRFKPVLRYHEGAFAPLPMAEKPLLGIFSSPSGVLHASDGEVIHRFEGGAWQAVAVLPERETYGHPVIDDRGVMWGYGAARLRGGPMVPAPEPCEKPFVYLYASSWVNGYQKNFTYPSTRKALSSFPGVASVELVEFGKDNDDKHLGARVASRAQAEALVAHVKATMKDEDPKLFCYEPEAPRKIDIAGK